MKPAPPKSYGTRRFFLDLALQQSPCQDRHACSSTRIASSSVTSLFTVTMYSFSWSLPARRICSQIAMVRENQPLRIFIQTANRKNAAAMVLISVLLHQLTDISVVLTNPNRFIQRDKHQVFCITRFIDAVARA